MAWGPGYRTTRNSIGNAASIWHDMAMRQRPCRREGSKLEWLGQRTRLMNFNLMPIRKIRKTRRASTLRFTTARQAIFANYQRTSPSSSMTASELSNEGIFVRCFFFARSAMFPPHRKARGAGKPARRGRRSGFDPSRALNLGTDLEASSCRYALPLPAGSMPAAFAFFVRIGGTRRLLHETFKESHLIRARSQNRRIS